MVELKTLTLMPQIAGKMCGKTGPHHVLTRSYALQLASENVTVVAVAPGLVDTDMARPLIEAGTAKTRIPMGRAGTADEIAQAAMLAVLNNFCETPE